MPLTKRESRQYFETLESINVNLYVKSGFQILEVSYFSSGLRLPLQSLGSWDQRHRKVNE